MIKSITNIKDKVQELLEKYEHLRDNDNKLIANIYYQVACLRANDEIYSAMDFLKDFSIGLFPSPESIRRCRQKIQEDNETLRGKSYKERKKKSIEMRNKIKDL